MRRDRPDLSSFMMMTGFILSFAVILATMPK
jgi:hypothetical protein